MKLNNDNLTRLYRVHLLLQIASEQIEEMQNNSVFKHENKQRINNVNTWLNTMVENFTLSCNQDELNDYNESSQKIREFINQIKIQYE